MKIKTFSILSALLIAVLIFSSASAGGAVKLSGVSFKLGSLIANGFASGLGKTDVTVVLDASGIAAVICTNNGSNDVPGQSSPKVSGAGFESLPGNDPLRKNGKSPFGVETVDPTTVSWEEGGCPNSNWSARIDFIFWTNATISVYDSVTNALLTTQDYICTTTRTSVSCTPVK